MSAPLPVVRAVMLERDQHRCAACAARSLLEAQHRQAVGAGGSKIRPTLTQLVTLCTFCNEAVEHTLQAVALKNGWKVRGWVTDCSLVPVWYVFERTWYRLTVEGARVRLTVEQAMQMMVEVYGPEYDPELGLVGGSVSARRRQGGPDAVFRSGSGGRVG